MKKKCKTKGCPYNAEMEVYGLCYDCFIDYRKNNLKEYRRKYQRVWARKKKRQILMFDTGFIWLGIAVFVVYKIISEYIKSEGGSNGSAV